MGLRTSLADTEVVLQESLVALESERSALVLEQSALESERKARSEMDQEVLALWGLVMGTEEVNARLCAQTAQ